MALASLPSLPSLSSFTQAQAPTTTTDALGNIFNAAGVHIGVVPGSIADIGSASRTSQTSQSSSGVPQTNQSPTVAGGGTWDKLKAAGSAIGSLATLEAWAANLVSRKDPHDRSGVTLEDIVFIALGLVLITAALFSFKTTQTFAKEFTKSAIKAAAAP